MLASGSSNQNQSNAKGPCSGEPNCLKRATCITKEELNDLRKQDYVPETNDMKLEHCLNSCNAQKECLGGASGAAAAAAAAALGTLANGGTQDQADRNAAKAVMFLAGINFAGGVGYEIETLLGFKFQIGGTRKDHPKFDGQHPRVWPIDTAGDILANAIGILAALADLDCKDACKSAHKIPGPDYSGGWYGGKQGDKYPPIRSGIGP